MNRDYKNENIFVFVNCGSHKHWPITIAFDPYGQTVPWTGMILTYCCTTECATVNWILDTGYWKLDTERVVDCGSRLYLALKYCPSDRTPVIALFRARIVLARIVVEFIASQFWVTHVGCSRCSSNVSNRSSWTLDSMWFRLSYKPRKSRCALLVIAHDHSISVAPCKV